MKTAKIKLEFEDRDIPRGIILQAVQHGLRGQNLLGEDEKVPAGTQITLEKLGEQDNGRFLCYAHVTLPEQPDEVGDLHFKEFYGLEDEDYLVMPATNSAHSPRDTTEFAG